jgi:hypothetical protein
MAFSQLERPDKEQIAVYVKVLPCHLPNWEVENREEFLSGQMESQPSVQKDTLPSTWISDSTGSIWGKV